MKIEWLANEAVRRFFRLNPDWVSQPGEFGREKVVEIRKTRGGVFLDPEDDVVDVLDDNDFVSIRLENDLPDSNASAGTFDHSLPEAFAPIHKFDLSQEEIALDGQHLSIGDLVLLGKGKTKLKLRRVAEERVTCGRNLVEAILKENRVIYGVTTGFGKFARTVISPENLEQLQENLIRSHSAGVGAPLPLNRVRMLLALRINILAKGNSGISLKVLQQIINAFNCSCLPWVPEQGTVGASGDLAPLSHLALGMMGEGICNCFNHFFSFSFL